MRLSETRQPRTSGPHRFNLAREEKAKQRKTLVVRTSLSVGVLALLVAAAVGAIALERHLVTRAADTAPNPNCTLIVPNQPLTAQGLATPYQLVATDPNQGPCNESNGAQSAFVQGAVVDPATGQVSIYNPLVIDQGTQPAAAPVVPQLPQNGVVALWFGFNGSVLRLKGAAPQTLGGARCVNGLGDNPFGQVAYCNAPQFFRVANMLIRAGALTPPALGTALDGLPCPTVRDFSLVDQDQSDNVTTTYLVMQNGQTAQNNAANAANLAGAQPEANGSDEGLLSRILDKALGCTPWMAPDLANNGAMVPALPLNELQAAAEQQAPVALVPLGDPMTLQHGDPNPAKTDLYRAGVDQPMVQNGNGSTATYCKNLLQIGPARIQQDMKFTMGQPSPDAGAANNLFTFLAQRFNFSFSDNGLNCTGLLNQPNPIALQQDSNGVTIGATITVPGQNQGSGGNTSTPTPTPGNGNGNSSGGNTPTSTPTPGNGGNGGNGGNTGNSGQGTAPTCVVNGVTVQGCAGTIVINGQTCIFAFDANTQQVTITCP